MSRSYYTYMRPAMHVLCSLTDFIADTIFICVVCMNGIRDDEF